MYELHQPNLGGCQIEEDNMEKKFGEGVTKILTFKKEALKCIMLS
jgi:hypothetical protein